MEQQHTNAIIPRLKGKPKYYDAPRFKLIYQYEGELVKEYESMVQDMVKNIGRKMKQIIEE